MLSHMSSSGNERFLQYHEPGIVEILVVISFFTFLSVAEYVSSKIIRAGIIGPIIVGIIYGKPVGNILHEDWQETFLYLGYIGLIIIIFEGGLTARLDLLRENFVQACWARRLVSSCPSVSATCFCILASAMGPSRPSSSARPCLPQASARPLRSLLARQRLWTFRRLVSVQC